MVMTRKFEEVATEIRARILSLRYGTEGGLPETRELAKSFGCSINTVSLALVSLESQRIIEKRGHTYYVSQHAVPMTGYLPLLMNRVPSGEGFYRTIGSVARVYPPEHIVRKLGMSNTESAVYRVQVSGEIADTHEKPLQLTYRYHFGMTDDQLSRLQKDPYYHPLLAEKEHAGTLHSVDEITPRIVTESECLLLGLPVGTPVTHLFETIHSLDNKLLIAQDVVLPPNETLIFSFSFVNRPSDKQ